MESLEYFQVFFDDHPSPVSSAEYRLDQLLSHDNHSDLFSLASLDTPDPNPTGYKLRARKFVLDGSDGLPKKARTYRLRSLRRLEKNRKLRTSLPRETHVAVVVYVSNEALAHPQDIQNEPNTVASDFDDSGYEESDTAQSAAYLDISDGASDTVKDLSDSSGDSSMQVLKGDVDGQGHGFSDERRWNSKARMYTGHEEIPRYEIATITQTRGQKPLKMEQKRDSLSARVKEWIPTLVLFFIAWSVVRYVLYRLFL